MLLLAIWKYQWKLQLQIWLSRLKIFDSDTKIVDALLASSAFPGIISPYEINTSPLVMERILNHFLQIFARALRNYYRVYVSPIQKIEAKDLHSSALYTGFDIFHILTYKSSIFVIGLSNQRVEYL
jgi:hypothetical protein